MCSSMPNRHIPIYFCLCCNVCINCQWPCDYKFVCLFMCFSKNNYLSRGNYFLCDPLQLVWLLLTYSALIGQWRCRNNVYYLNMNTGSSLNTKCFLSTLMGGWSKFFGLNFWHGLFLLFCIFSWLLFLLLSIYSRFRRYTLRKPIKPAKMEVLCWTCDFFYRVITS